jgi:hypothetical protein
MKKCLLFQRQGLSILFLISFLNIPLFSQVTAASGIVGGRTFGWNSSSSLEISGEETGREIPDIRQQKPGFFQQCRDLYNPLFMELFFYLELDILFRFL